MNEITQKWLEAAKILIKDPKVKIICPECNKGTLIIKDEEFSETQIDRYMICDNCGRWEVITVGKPKSDNSENNVSR